MSEEKDFYSPSEISFSKPQVVWLLKHLAIIRVGSWPSDYKETGYTGSKKGTLHHRAYFETPVSIAAELDHRIEQAGVDGILLEFVCSVDPADKVQLEYHIAQAMRLELNDIDRRIETALRFCSGYHRKSRNYRQFRLHKRGGQ